MASSSSNSASSRFAWTQSAPSRSSFARRALLGDKARALSDVPFLQRQMPLNHVRVHGGYHTTAAAVARSRTSFTVVIKPTA